MPAQRLLLAAGCAVALLAAPALAAAQTVAQTVAKPVAKSAAASGVKSYEAGARAFEAGKYGPAIQSLSTAIAAGSLSSQQMAKALYYRGVAYRKTGKTAQAISDLTSAVWLKNGLNDSDRAAAMDERQAAYKEAGLGEGVPVGAAPLDAPPSPATASPAPSSPAMATLAPPAATVAAGPADTATSSWTATSAKGAAAASVPDLSQPSAPPVSSSPPAGYATLQTSEPSAPVLSALPQGEAAAEPTSSPLSGVGTAVSDAGAAVGSFFGNMFGGGGSEATSEASAPVTTAATAPYVASDPTSPASGWGSGTSVVEGTAKKAGAAAGKPRTAAGGQFRLQVGVVRSRAEAEKIAATLKSSHGAALGKAVPAIDEVVYGNMGTFYRVQVGPYASAAEPGQFCTALKPQGYDCMVITQ